MSNTEEKERLAAVFRDLFGDQCTVNTELGLPGPLIDVCEYAPARNVDGELRKFFTVVTWRMSNQRMPNPNAETPYRSELILYCSQPKPSYHGLLRELAKVPFVESDVWYDFGTTVAPSDPPQPLFERSSLSSILFLWPPIVGDQELYEMVQIEGDPVVLLWVVPIAESERQFIVDRGADAFLDILDEREHPFLLDEHRQPYV